MKIYIDGKFKCYTESGDGLTPIETEFFDGKSPGYIAGYRFVPDGETWTRSDGVKFQGEMIAPWKPWEELDEVQRAYEREQVAELETALSDIEEALGL